MSVKDLLKKMQGMEGIDEKDIEELEAELEKASKKVDGSKSVAELKEAKAAQARILEEKKKLAEKNAELEAAIEEMKSGDLSEVEKSQKEMEKLLKTKEKLEASLEEMKQKATMTERNYKLEKLSSKIKFIDSVPEDMKNYAVQNAFKDVEDLDDSDMVTKIIENFQETHKGVLASENAARGSGSGPSRQVESSAKSPDKMSVDERAKYLREKSVERKII